MLAILSRKAVAASGFVERYVLSLVYLVFAWTEFDKLAIKPEVRPLILKQNAARLLKLV